MRTRCLGRPAPRPAPSQAAAAFLILALVGAIAPAGNGRRTPTTVSEQDALDIVAKLPEVRAFGAMLARVTKGTVRPTMYCEEKPRPDDENWQVYVGENHDNHAVIWNRFRVGATTGDVAVWDFSDDGWVPLVKWRREAAANVRATAEGRVGATSSHTGSPPPDELDRTAFTYDKRTGTESYERVVRIGPKVSFRASVETTSKGNGSLEIANLRLRVLDEHDDGSVFEPPLLNVEFVDVTGDGYKDIFLCGCLKRTGEKGTDPASIEPVGYLYVFRQKEGTFARRYAHGPALDF